MEFRRSGRLGLAFSLLLIVVGGLAFWRLGVEVLWLGAVVLLEWALGNPRASLLVLVSLCDGPKHGYSMQRDIETFAGTRLGPGTLYGAITTLERDGLIEAMPSADRRRPYQSSRCSRLRSARGP